MKLYTKTGDGGQTGLIGAERVAKDHDRVCAYGEVDELNAVLGWAMCECRQDDWQEPLRAIQSDLFILGVELATAADRSPTHRIGQGEVSRLEKLIDSVFADRKLTHFVLPGGSELASRFHLARAVCRRAERSVVRCLSEAQLADRNRLAVTYLNRLADLLFALALEANQRAGVADVPWIAPPATPNTD